VWIVNKYLSSLVESCSPILVSLVLSKYYGYRVYRRSRGIILWCHFYDQVSVKVGTSISQQNIQNSVQHIQPMKLSMMNNIEKFSL
jgi:hypothetical protein